MRVWLGGEESVDAFELFPFRWSDPTCFYVDFLADFFAVARVAEGAGVSAAGVGLTGEWLVRGDVGAGAKVGVVGGV